MGGRGGQARTRFQYASDTTGSTMWRLVSHNLVTSLLFFVQREKRGETHLSFFRMLCDVCTMPSHVTYDVPDRSVGTWEFYPMCQLCMDEFISLFPMRVRSIFYMQVDGLPLSFRQSFLSSRMLERRSIREGEHLMMRQAHSSGLSGVSAASASVIGLREGAASAVDDDDLLAREDGHCNAVKHSLRAGYEAYHGLGFNPTYFIHKRVRCTLLCKLQATDSDDRRMRALRKSSSMSTLTS
jgi:hypothetical protein